MAKFALFFALAVVAIAFVSQADALKCYQCDGTCKDISEKSASACSDADAKFCYIRGDSEKEAWYRGCAKTEAEACPTAPTDVENYECSSCEDDECNSGSFLTASIAMTVGIAAIVNMMR